MDDADRQRSGGPGPRSAAPLRSAPQRTRVHGAGGAPVLDYVDRSRDGVLIAGDARALIAPEEAAAAAAEQLAGWALVAQDPFAAALAERGGLIQRRAHEMRRDLSEPLPEGWPAGVPGGGLELRPFGAVGVPEVFAAVAAAFPPEHPDRAPGAGATVEYASFAQLAAGTALGPVLPLSELVIDPEAPDGERVAAGLVLTDRPDDVPWIAEVFRRPGRRYAGLGRLLLRRALAEAAAGGIAEVGLAVTDGNPARHLYTRLGFRSTGTFTTVVLPPTPG
ncbi:GNAT family N-acetyltransferase [Nocardiopsis coralliicola]